MNNGIRLKNYTYVFVLTGIVFLFSIYMSLIYRVSVLTNGIPFFFFFIAGMLLPGYTLVNLLKIKVKSDVELLAYSLFMGYLLTFIEYFLCVPIGLKKFAWLFFVVTMLLSLCYLFKLKKNNDFVKVAVYDDFGMKLVFIFVVVILGFESIAYAGCNMLPVVFSESYIEPDPLFWVRNTVRFFREFKVYFNYHWFTSAQLAFVSLVTGIRPIVLSYAFEFITPVFMMVLGGYLVFSNCTTNKKLILLAVFSLFFTFGSPDLAVVDYSSLLMEPFALDYGMGIFLFVMYLMINEFKGEKTTYKNLVILILLFGLLCGVKANYGAIALVGIGFVCMKWFFGDKQIKRALLVGIPALITFGLSYIFVTNMKGYTENDLGRAAEVVDNFRRPIIYASDENNVYNFAMRLPFPSVINHVIFVVCFLLVSHPFLFSAIFFQIGRAICKKERLKSGSVILLGMIFVCVFIRMVIGMNGNTEEYFFINVIPICIAFVMLNWKDNYSNNVMTVLKKTIVFVLVLVSFVGWTTEHYRFEVYKILKTGVKNICGIGEDYNQHSKWVSDGFINSSEMEALEWIRANLSENEVFATNNPYRVVECVSERLPVLYSDFEMLVDEDIEADEKDLVDRIQSDKIQYIYFDRVLKDMDDYEFMDERLKIVYENEDAVVFSVE